MFAVIRRVDFLTVLIANTILTAIYYRVASSCRRGSWENPKGPVGVVLDGIGVDVELDLALPTETKKENAATTKAS